MKATRPDNRGFTRTRPLGAFALIVAALLSLAAAPAPEQGDPPDGPTYGARPAHHADGARAGRMFAHALEVGTVVTDAVEIFNFTGEPASFDIYPADMVRASGDTLAPAARESELTGAGAWLALEEQRVEIPPRTSVLVPFTIEVPPGTVPGAHVAALLVEPIRRSTGQTIEARARVAMQVQLDVLGEIDLGVQLGSLQWRQSGREVHFDLPVRNGGNVTFVADGIVVVEGRDVVRLRDVPLLPAARTLAPGATTRFEAVWVEPPWIGRVTARAVVEAQAGDRAPVEFVGEPVTFWVVPWTSLLVAAGVLALLTAILLASRERRGQWRERRREEREVLREYRARRRSPQPDVDHEAPDDLRVG
jgi:hypothetical protein